MSSRIGIAAFFTAAVAVACVLPARAQLWNFGPTGLTPAALAKKLDQPVAPELLSTLAQASRRGLAFRAQPAATDLAALSGPRFGADGKVGLLYVGADFCPYCAGDRWGLMLVLLRFGKLSGLRYMLSTATDVYPNTPTVTFQHASYRSPYVAFQAVEIADRAGHPLALPNASQMKIFSVFDAPPYTRFSETIPFVYIGGKYRLNQLLVLPTALSGDDWQQVATALANPHSSLFRSVMPRVNLLTAAICHLDGGKPVDVCTAPGVKVAHGVLAGLHAGTAPSR